MLYIADLFCLHGNMRPGIIIITLFFSALKLFFDVFVFLVKISRLYSFFKIDKIENVSSQGAALNGQQLGVNGHQQGVNGQQLGVNGQ